MFFTVTSSKTIEQAITDIGINLREQKFKILWQMNIPDKLAEKGVSTYKNQYRVLEVCNPHDAAAMLHHNELAGYFIPCKIVVYKSEGQTKIGLPRIAALTSAIQDAEISQIAEKAERTLIQVIEQSK